MQCKEFRNYLLDVASGDSVTNEVRQHAASCPDCAAEVASWQNTMLLLDEWQAPRETSPYFMTRLRARIREEGGLVPAGWLAWFRKPALVVSVAVLLVASISLIGYRNGTRIDNGNIAHGPSARVSSPVNDLQYLDDNKDLLANFELLDEVQGSQAQ